MDFASRCVACQVSLEEYVQRHGHIVNPNLVGRISWGTTDVLELTATGTISTPPGGFGYGTRFNYTTDHGTILRKDIYEMLEKVMDRYRDAAATALQIVLKHS